MIAELTLDAKAQLGEGSIWDPHAGVLWWIDIKAAKLFRYQPETGENKTYELPSQPGTVVPRESSGLVIALENGFFYFDPETQKLQAIGDPEADIPTNRFNDGKCDPAGRFWAGTMSMSGQDRDGKGSVYCLYPDKSIQKKIDAVTVSNGICWSLDTSIIYYVDTPLRRVDAFDYDNQSGEISGRRTVIEIPEGTGMPDGMTLDEQGNLWIAKWGGNRVSCWNPNTGKKLEEVEVPSRCVTSCAFGGPELDTLYITAASVGYQAEDWEKEPHGGGLFQVRPGVRGIPACRFAG